MPIVKMLPVAEYPIALKIDTVERGKPIIVIPEITLDEIDYMYEYRRIAPNERKPRECEPPMIDAQQECHRTRGGRGVVGRLTARSRSS